MMNCKQATRICSESLERPLKTAENLELKVHLAICSGCRNFNRQMQTLRNLARDYAKESGEEGGIKDARET
ncbi:zf-HC2 domain-containing protein [Microbulbifer aggregans]|uniref:anti-sigma factor family protein n=1 Tax=Microbulbifer aggregans TaxID=1769779 RepID=UPI001CFEAF7E|nr:zf-HC2 domain-containing protein [Microbulbifer aggregans]